MADIQSNIDINIETGSALANIRALQREISVFHSSMAKGGAAANAQSAQMQQNLINTINTAGRFSASMRTIATTTETFTNALERNKLSMGEYFRYAGAASGKFGRTFATEMSTIDKVARERVKDLQTQYIKLGRDANGALRSIAVRPLALDMDNLATKTAMAAQKQQLFNQLVSQGSTNLLNFGKNTQWAGRQLMVGFTIPLALFGAAASKSFMDLEKETIKFKKVYGDLFTLDTEKDQALADIEELAKAMTKYGVTITDTIALASEAAAAGFAGESLKAQTEQATRLSVLGQIETQKALETTIALQSAFQISNEDLAGSINFLNAVENQTVLSLDDVTTAIPKVAPVIQQLGGDVKDLAFFLAAMKEGGINASEGANALKSGLASMINPTRQSVELLSSMGININAIIEGSQGDLKSTVVGFAQALDQLDPLSRARAIEQLFGKFQFARISALFSNVIRDGSQAGRVLDLAGTSLEELSSLAEGELGIVADATSTKFTAAMERIKLSIAPIGEEFLKLITPIIEFGANALESFNQLDGGLRQFIVGTIGVLGGIAPVAIMTFGLLANGAANAIKGLLFLRNTFLRAGNGSTVLGQQVDYMTQQQIEASAVAASLGQTHSRLTQIFTSEATAVQQLAAAYQSAVNAQRNFSGPIVGRGPVGARPPGYSRGIISVPGTGNRDTEAAMLTPGEAVIPAPMAKKYAPLIEGMISGSIPGFNSGRLGKAYTNATMFLPESMNTAMGSPMGAGVGAATADVVAYMKQAGAAAAAPLLAVMAKEMGLKLNDPSLLKEWSTAGDKLITAAADALEKSGRTLVNDDDMEEVVVPAFKNAAKEISVAGKSIATALDNSLDQIRTVGQVGASSGAKGGLGRTALPGSYRRERVNSQRFAGGLNPEMFQTTQRQSSQSGRMMNSFKTVNPATGQLEVATMAHIRRSVTMSVDKIIREVAPYLGDQTARILRATGTAVVDGVKTSTKQASPSKEARKAGENIGIGAIQGIKSQQDEAVAAGEAVGKSAVTGTRRAARDQGAPGMASPSQSQQIAGPRRVTTGVIVGGPVLPIDARGNPVESAQRVVEANEDVARSSNNFVNKLTGISYAITAVTGGLSMFGGGLSEAASVIFQVSSLFSGLAFAMQMFPNQLSKLSTFISAAPARFAEARNPSPNILPGGAFGPPTQAAAGAAKAGGALAGLARGVVAFLGPWGIVIGLVTVLGSTLLPALLNVIDEQIKKQNALSDATNFTSESLKDLATRVGGTYTGGAIQGATLAGKTEQEKTQAQELSQDQGFLDTYKSQIEGLKNLDAAGLKFALDNLTKSLLAGGTSPEAINSIINALLAASNRGATPYGMEGIAAVQAQGPGNYASMIAEQERSARGGTANITNVDEVVNTTSQAINAATAALQTGQISAAQFDEEMKKISETISTIPATQLNSDFQNYGDTMDKLVDSLALGDDKLAQNIKGLEDYEDQMRVLEALAKGASNIDPEIFDLLNSDVEGDQEEAIRRINAAITEGVAARQSATVAEEEAAVAAQNRAEIDEYNASIENKVVALNNEILAYDILIANGYSAADALDAVADSQFNAAMAAAVAADQINGTTTEVANLLAQLNGLRALEGKSPIVAARRASVGRSGGGGGGPQASALDDLLSKMNKVVSVQTVMTKGWKASRTMLDGLFGGSATTGNFGGLEQQMRNLGAGEPLIDLIAGMPAEEFNKRKNELFVFDGSGNIRGFRDSLASIGEALRKIALGEFQNKQKATVKSFNDQMVAINKLVAAGASYADAYEIVQDAAVASAIANEKSSASIQQIVRDARAAEKALKDMAAAQSIAGLNDDFVNQQQLLAKLQENNLNLSNDQIQAILDSSDLQRLFMDPSIDAESLEQALNDVAVRQQIELQVKKLTIDGLESIFEDGLSKAMEAFSAKEQQIEIEFTTRKKPFEDIIRDAEQQISDITNSAGGLDDLEADLERISIQEEAINKKYEDRQKALAQVRDINAAISAQQKSQLTLADALSQGDIAAAARAAQEMREQLRQKAVENQEKALEQAKEAEVAALLGNLGLTREQIETRIRDLKKQILEIEESTLEPAQYAVELLDREQETLLASLTVLGMTKLEWEAIKNNIDLAKTSSDSYEAAMREALGVVTDIVHYWDELDGKQVETVHIIKTVYENIGSPPSAGTIPPSGDSGTGNGKPDAPGTPGTPKPPTAAPVYSTLRSAYDAAKGSSKLGSNDRLVLTNLWNDLQKAPGSVTKQNSLAKYLKSYGFTVSGYPKSTAGGPPNQFMNAGGMVKALLGGSAMAATMGTDRVPTTLAPGEFVVSKYGAQKFGANNLKAVNNGTFSGGSVYNYDININVRSEADPNKIARVVQRTISHVDSQRIRSSVIG